MNQDLVCIVYYSSARRPFDTSALSRLLATSRRNNGANELTGMLLFHDGNFVQAVEGPRDSVERTFERIKHDPSHGDILKVGPMKIEQRYFPDWTMGVLAKPLLSLAGQEAVTDFLHCKLESAADHPSIAWRLLNSFREGVSQTG